MTGLAWFLSNLALPLSVVAILVLVVSWPRCLFTSLCGWRTARVITQLRRRSGGDAGQAGVPLPPGAPVTGIEPPAPARAGSPGSLPPVVGRTGSGTPAGTDVDADPPGRHSRACRTPAPVGGIAPARMPSTGLHIARVIVHG